MNKEKGKRKISIKRFLLLFFVYFLFVNNHVTKAIYVIRLELHIRKIESRGASASEQQKRGWQIKSLEGKKIVLQTFKEMKPSYALNFIGPIGFNSAETIYVGDIPFVFGVESQGYTIKLGGIWHNYYDVGTNEEQNRKFFDYINEILW
ncbi:MAG: hypothetical protein LBS21_15655 [Clostridiales bacterium]|jgi:hypothetical protein|nr:hypothetical protein [Clostridiales bacterium]